MINRIYRYLIISIFTILTTYAHVQHQGFGSVAIDAHPPMIRLSFIQLAHPVLAMLKATTSLYRLNSSAQKIDTKSSSIYTASPEKVYFDSRYQQLKQLKQEFSNIHTGLKSVASNCPTHAQMLVCKSMPYPNLISIITMTAESEYLLDAQDKSALTDIREDILYTMQEDICNLQICIGLYANEFLHRKNETIQYYNNIIKKADNAIYNTIHLPETSSYDDTKKYYRQALICSMLIQEIEERITLLQGLIQFFSKYSTNRIINTTSNIIEILDKEKVAIDTSMPVIQTTKKDLAAFAYFGKHTPVPNITQEITAIKTKLHESFKADLASRSGKKSYANAKPQKKI